MGGSIQYACGEPISDEAYAGEPQRINGVEGVLRTGITSVYQLLIGFIYGIGTSDAAWAAVLITGSLFVVLCFVLIVEDKKVYKNLYL